MLFKYFQLGLDNALGNHFLNTEYVNPLYKFGLASLESPLFEVGFKISFSLFIQEIIGTHYLLHMIIIAFTE